jgi:hypothetical protein
VEGVHRPRPQVALVLLAAVACTAPESNDAWPEERAPVDAAIGWIDGDPITYGELARFLRARDALTFSRILDSLIVDRITRAEAELARVDVPVAAVERATRTRYLTFEQRLKAATREQGGRELDPAVWLDRTLGLTPEQFRLFLRAQIEVELLQDRLIRYAERIEPTVEVSVIVVEKKEDADTVIARLEKGEAFGMLARELSRHSTAPKGGRIENRMLEKDFDDETAARQLLVAEPGSVHGPYERAADGQVFYRIYRLEERNPAEEKPYRELAPSIEADLEKRPVSMGEYVYWRRRMQDRHGFLPASSGPATAVEK